MKKQSAVAEPSAPPEPPAPTPQEKLAKALSLAREVKELEGKQRVAEGELQHTLDLHRRQILDGREGDARNVQRLRGELDAFPEAIRVRRERVPVLVSEAVAEIEATQIKRIMPRYFEARSNLCRVLEAVAPAWSALVDLLQENRTSGDAANAQISRIQGCGTQNLRRIVTQDFGVPSGLDIPTLQQFGFLRALDLLIKQLQ